MNDKTGLKFEFSFCHRRDGDKFCVMCDKEQREQCESIANMPRYSDDPRNAAIDEAEGMEP